MRTDLEHASSRFAIRQFGIITALTTIYSLTAAVLVEPACLELWAEYHAPEGTPVPPPTDAARTVA